MSTYIPVRSRIASSLKVSISISQSVRPHPLDRDLELSPLELSPLSLPRPVSPRREERFDEVHSSSSLISEKCQVKLHITSLGAWW